MARVLCEMIFMKVGAVGVVLLHFIHPSVTGLNQWGHYLWGPPKLDIVPLCALSSMRTCKMTYLDLRWNHPNKYSPFASILDLKHLYQCTSTVCLLSALALFPSTRVFLSYSHIHTFIQFSHRRDFDGFISYVFKCTAFCYYSALNNAVCWKSICRSDSLSSKARVLFWFLNGFKGIGELFFVWFCSIPHMRSKRLLSELLPRLWLPSSLSPACTLRLKFFSSSLLWLTLDCSLSKYWSTQTLKTSPRRTNNLCPSAPQMSSSINAIRKAEERLRK